MIKKGIFLLLALFLLTTNSIPGETMNQNNVSIKAPEFPSGMEWLNTDNSLKLQDLHGKIVLLDFWTYCCINCMHIIPELKKLEKKYEDELVVIGVHSAKFFTEQGTENIRQAILRYEIEHPVVNDKDFKIWDRYAARAWPTLVLINPKGEIVGTLSGENIYEPIDGAIKKLIKKYDKQIDRTPLHFVLEKDKTPMTFLRFPGKITADATLKKLYITDSNNNRIVITNLNGKILDIIGSGREGQQDGSFEKTEFFHPQGTAIDSNFIYIADTENHLIRKANLKTRTVETIAGVGKQVYLKNPDGAAKQTGLNSPWDLVLHDNVLYIAMAGQHQIWRLNLQDHHITLHAGSGRENIVDGSLRQAQLAQPSGITTDGKQLYFADSEVSAIRSADINPDGNVKTLVGQGLFEFGDVGGEYKKARLQHPLGIEYVDGKIYVADTYNNKIKAVDLQQQRITTFAGTGHEGMEDGNPQKVSFNEPGGISYADGKLYVADTNNHLIRLVDIGTGRVSTLKIKGIKKETTPVVFNKNNFNGPVEMVDLNLQHLQKLHFSLHLPDGFKLNPLADSQIRLFTADNNTVQANEIQSLQFSETIDEKIKDKLYAELVLYYCREDNEGLCYIQDVLFELNHKNNDKKQKEYTIHYNVSPS